MDILAEFFWTVCTDDPVKEDPENAAAGAARVIAMRIEVFMLILILVLILVCRECFMIDMRKTADDVIQDER